MLVRLILALSDAGLCQRFEKVADDPDLIVEVVAPGVSLGEACERSAPDLILADGPRLAEGGQIAEAVARLSNTGGGPALLYLAVRDDAEARAAALAAGCIAVLDAEAPDAALEEALLAVLHSWREKAEQLFEAEQAESFRLGDFVSKSPTMARFMKVARRVCDSKSSVLILGETGVGKERLANAIHAEGPRANGPFIVVNAGAIPETLLESELFGHEKGAFTGAHKSHRGYFEVAHGGTIFLDEIGELPLHLQVKLLRVLQEREIQRIGAEKATSIDVRVIAATNRNLKDEMTEGRFRSDLYYRLSVVTLTIPPLRERREDIPLMVETYLQRFAVDLGSQIDDIDPRAMQALQNYPWPGNVREVINVVERAVLLCEGLAITLDDLPEEIAGNLPPNEVSLLVEEAQEPIADLQAGWFEMSLREAKRAWLDAFEQRYLVEVLKQTRGKINETAVRAGIDPRSLYDKMRRFGLKKEDFKKPDAQKPDAKTQKPDSQKHEGP